MQQKSASARCVLWHCGIRHKSKSSTSKKHFVHFESKLECKPTHYVSPPGVWISRYRKCNCLFFHNTCRTYPLISILPPREWGKKLLCLLTQKQQPIHLSPGRRRYQAAAAAETAAYHPTSSRASISSVSCQLKMSPVCQTRASNAVHVCLPTTALCPKLEIRF